MNAATNHERIPPLGPQIAEMAVVIADAAARHFIETHAMWMPSNAPAWVYDVSRLDPERPTPSVDPEIEASDLQDLAQAVSYLEARGLIRRPVAGQPQFVSFGGE